MTQLIPLQPQTINGNAVETVSARELHSFLEVRSKFADWIKNRISEYDFTANQDFITLNKKMERGQTQEKKPLLSKKIKTLPCSPKRGSRYQEKKPLLSKKLKTSLRFLKI